MKVINIMNFARQCDPRLNGSEDILFDCTRREMELINEYGCRNTFLMQYDALIDPRYQKLFKENPNRENTELGLWLEIVEPLVRAVGLPWRGRPGWKWDWYVVPGFSMAYTPEERRLLIDECMHKFMEVFGVYPKTVCSWLLDTVTARYLSEKYNISFMGICRDQVNTDAYTLIGGYFNQGYYPSVNNIFTPAQSAENQINTPVFRLLGPDPIHNYDGLKYLFDPETNYFANENSGLNGVCTMEAVWCSGFTPQVFDWFMKTFYENESLGFAYSQIGQENSFGYTDFIPALRMQLDTLKNYPDIQVLTMAETGEAFKKLYASTPATCVTALSDWNRGSDVQTVCYDSKNYCANILRVKGRLFIRSLYLFDERVQEHYLSKPATNWDATYENLPVIDTLKGDERGLQLDVNADVFTVSADGENLTVTWNNGCVVFTPESIRIDAPEAKLFTKNHPASPACRGTGIDFIYGSARYALTSTAALIPAEFGFGFAENRFSLGFERKTAFTPVPVLETPRLILRKAKESDLEAIYTNVWSDDSLAENMMWVPTHDIVGAKDRLARTMKYQSDYHAYFVCLKDTDEPIGFAGIHEQFAGRYCESGICVCGKYQRMGFGKEIVSALVSLAFDILGGNTFVYEAFSENTASRNLAESCGFVHMGSHLMTRPHDKKEFIIEEYELTR